MAYADTTELARVLKLRSPSPEQGTALQRVLDTAAFEIDEEIGTSYLGGTVGTPAMLAQVNLERAVEHWQQQEVPFGAIGFGDSVPVFSATDSWRRHAEKLSPLKVSWGIG